MEENGRGTRRRRENKIQNNATWGYNHGRGRTLGGCFDSVVISYNNKLALLESLRCQFPDLELPQRLGLFSTPKIQLLPQLNPRFLF